ncbi:MFS transporter [Novosphingobium endophyticum]|uniref:MFS transporter n=1 Tax=Novosphingobium endophyticum TaxID=1955250 RepID=A0A916TW71_9SPHN|nr:MFS transporter [Novosphingobium endophyticum]
MPAPRDIIAQRLIRAGGVGHAHASSARVQRTVREEWRQHWTLVLASGVGLSLHTVSTYTLGLVMEPLNAEFGWSRTQISVVSLIPAILMVLFSPLMGAIIDRWGSRRLALPSIVLTGLSLAMISLANGSTAQWMMLWLFYGVVTLGIKVTVWTTAISGAFSAGRGLALGTMLCGAALSQIGVPPLAQWLVDDYGWRTAYVAVALVWTTPALILAMLFLKDPRPAAAKTNETPSAPANAELPGLSVLEALRNAPLMRIAVSTLLTMFIGTAILVHQVPILTDAGVSRGNAALLASLAGLAGIVGKLFTGWMTDRWDASLIGALTLLAPIIAYVNLLYPSGSIVLMMLAMIIIGYTTGAKLQISAYLTAQHAGMRVARRSG